MTRALMNRLLYFPLRGAVEPPPGLRVEDLRFETGDGERLHGWWVPAGARSRGHVLFCHGNAGNIASRAAYARLLVTAGFDVLLFDYRGYGRSSGRPSEEGTYRDAHAAREALLGREEVQARGVLHLGESLGAAVALELASRCPPAGVILQSAFTSVRDMARAVYPFLPRAVVPDAYPSLRLVEGLASPLLVVHGEADEIVPLAQGRALYEAARVPKRMEILAGAGHNDLLPRAGDRWLAAVSAWSTEVAGLP